MKTFTLTTDYATYENCYLLTAKYMADNSMSIEVWNDEDGPIADLTRCLGNAEENQGYLDTNNCPWVENLVKELGIGKHTGNFQQSGFCIYPLYEFDEEKLKEYVNEKFGEEI